MYLGTSAQAKKSAHTVCVQWYLVLAVPPKQPGLVDVLGPTHLSTVHRLALRPKAEGPLGLLGRIDWVPVTDEKLAKKLHFFRPGDHF